MRSGTPTSTGPGPALDIGGALLATSENNPGHDNTAEFLDSIPWCALEPFPGFASDTPPGRSAPEFQTTSEILRQTPNAKRVTPHSGTVASAVIGPRCL
jgi:hypothetical protein